MEPYRFFSSASRLIGNAMSGKHHSVQVSGEDLQRLILWVDSDLAEFGLSEVRAMRLKDFVTGGEKAAGEPVPVIDRLRPPQDERTPQWLGHHETHPSLEQ
jgi:hypothetical protein